MKNSTQRNDIQQGCISQQRKLSFYEENYILEPEDYENDNDYFNYESDGTQDGAYYDESCQLVIYEQRRKSTEYRI